MRATHDFVGYALTPVHIGDGTTMTPDGYRLKQGTPPILERFDAPAVIAAMPTLLRSQYIKALSQGGLRQAQEIVSKAADGAIREWLAISEHSREEIERAMSTPLRRGSVSPFVRSGGTPIIPGSSVKGALRTAWLAGEAGTISGDRLAALAKEIKAAGPGRTGEQSDEIQRAAFDYGPRHTEQDPLRDLSVSDAPLGRDSTVVDRVQVANCTGEGPVAMGPEAKVQIHVERLASVADRGAFPAKPFKMAIAAAERVAIEERRLRAGSRAAGAARAVPSRSPGLHELRRATNAHHVTLWFYERQRFYLGTSTDLLMDELLRAFGFPERREAVEPALDKAGAWLLKLGRYAHFESKAVKVDNRLWGEKAGTRERAGTPGRPTGFMPEGASRTVARDADGCFLPFGWILLFPETTAPKSIPCLNPPRRAGAPSSQPRSSSAGGRAGPSPQYLFRKGDRVTNDEEEATVERDVRPTDTKMDVRFDDGEVEERPVAAWRRVP
jgi:hypothetical protein